tara:strand:- start:207 stop:470 length:264 start_codon:yes stop_codon:yes gene_type:complete
MTTIYTLTIKQQGRADRTSYFTTRSGAEDCRDELLTNFFANHLRTANKIKGALRGRGRPALMHLAAGMVAEEYSIVIGTQFLRGDTQ